MKDLHLKVQQKDDYPEQISTGKSLYKRFSPTEQYGCREGGKIHVIASLLAGAEVGTDQLTAPEGSFKREQQLGKIQEKRIEDWAKAAGFWISNTDETYEQTLGEKIAQGGEAIVFDNGNNVLKTIGLDISSSLFQPQTESLCTMLTSKKRK